MSEKYSALRLRFDGREPRREDMERIGELESMVRAKDGQLKASEDQMHKLRREMLLREDNYNKHFKNGGVAERVLDVSSALESSQGVVSWMISPKNRNG